ncbi:MAG: chaperone modulator CbpM [Panacibacter sp.]
MQTEELIPLQEFCVSHQVEQSFVYALHESGLVEIVHQAQHVYVPLNHLSQLEKMVRLYTDMDINLEGIEVITYLLQRMHNMQQQIIQLSNRLSLYESE